MYDISYQPTHTEENNMLIWNNTTTDISYQPTHTEKNNMYEIIQQWYKLPNPHTLRKNNIYEIIQ